MNKLHEYFKNKRKILERNWHFYFTVYLVLRQLFLKQFTSVGWPLACNTHTRPLTRLAITCSTGLETWQVLENGITIPNMVIGLRWPCNETSPNSLSRIYGIWNSWENVIYQVASKLIWRGLARASVRFTSKINQLALPRIQGNSRYLIARGNEFYSLKIQKMPVSSARKYSGLTDKILGDKKCTFRVVLGRKRNSSRLSEQEMSK